MLDWISDLLDSDTGFDSKRKPGSLLPVGLKRSLIELMTDCEAIYKAAGERCLLECPEEVGDSPTKFMTLMADLHRGVLLKTLIEIANCDRHWSMPEREAALIVLKHVWRVDMVEAELSVALRKVIEKTNSLRWAELFAPFVRMSALEPDIAALRSLTLRLAHLIAKADGRVLEAEQARLSKLQQDIDAVFRQVEYSAEKKKSKQPEADTKPAGTNRSPTAEEKERLFLQAQQELDSLIGLNNIKADIRQLIDFLKIQTARKEHQLPTAEISFHAVFQGNPGTGKTTVARIIGRLLAGLGILAEGHTVETDRSGLVAQFAGQTGPRTNERIDEAMGGVLFIDEAYSLVPETSEDMYGVEAVQALLKRMEDDRDSFIVVLAGYPRPMRNLLQSNPGLSSRFQKTYEFPDYTAKELLRIYYTFCRRYHYKLPKATRLKLIGGFQQALDERNEHFGNGRLARNLFESSIRHMSSRIVNVTPLTRELLTTIAPEDVIF